MKLCSQIGESSFYDNGIYYITDEGLLSIPELLNKMKDLFFVVNKEDIETLVYIKNNNIDLNRILIIDKDYNISFPKDIKINVEIIKKNFIYINPDFDGEILGTFTLNNKNTKDE